MPAPPGFLEPESLCSSCLCGEFLFPGLKFEVDEVNKRTEVNRATLLMAIPSTTDYHPRPPGKKET
ncbi:MAG: hypothetical protein ABIH23_33155, partial [bacterium]